MGRIITAVYGGNIGCDKPLAIIEYVGRLFQLEKQLVEWTRTLPLSLSQQRAESLPPDNREILLEERLGVILTLRYHNLRILLHRSFLVYFLDQLVQPALESQDLLLLLQVGPISVKACVDSAAEIISIVKTITQSTGPRRQMLGAWWFTLYYSMF